jgi:hypothetical protein
MNSSQSLPSRHFPASGCNEITERISKLPDLVELKEVFNMQYLVRCIEWIS